MSFGKNDITGAVSGFSSILVWDTQGRLKVIGGGTPPPAPVVWGSITGLVTNQTDLINYLGLNFYPLSSNPAGYLTDAPSDGSTYGRNNGAWAIVSGSGTLLALPFTTDHLTATSNPYVIGDVVYYSGNVYRCIANNDSILPTNVSYWTSLGTGFPLVEQPSDWNSTTGNNQILNKPTIPAQYNPTASTGISITGAYPNQTISNTLPDQTVVLTAGTGISVSGTYPSFTINNTSPGAGGGGAGGRNYYLNGGTVQGTFGGITDMREMNPIAVVGTNVDFTINANGYIKSFITDAGDPNQTVIPAGNWNFELWFSASSGGGSPQFYVELSKWDGSTFTLIATGSGAPEGITNGTTIDLYFTALSVPQTILTSTDRLAVRVYVIHSGRTITLHTQDSHLSQIITTFPSGLVSLNGLTGSVQTLSTGTTGTDFGITSSGIDHTFNLPVASATNTGKLSSGDWTSFNDKAPIASPAFTGNPTAPTPSSGDNDTSIATTAFVTDAVQSVASPIGIFGDGSNGAATITAGLTLTDDTYYTNLTISGAGSINLGGFRLFVNGTLDISNAGIDAIQNNGYAGNSATGAAGAANSGGGTNGRGGFGNTTSGWVSGGTGSGVNYRGNNGGAGGSAATNNAATAAANVATSLHIAGGTGGTGGAGGLSLVGPGGAGAVGQTSTASPVIFYQKTYVPNLGLVGRSTQNQTTATYGTLYTVGGRHGGGGGGGGSSPVAAGGGGGAAGGCGGITIVYAKNIVVGASTNAQTISARGGDGGAGRSVIFAATGGGGGAGAGGGGFVYLVYGTISGGSYTFVSANGGAGGQGGNGSSTGLGAQGGTGGSGGRIIAIGLGAGTITLVDGTGNLGATPAIPATTTGSAGSTGGTCTYSS